MRCLNVIIYYNNSEEVLRYIQEVLSFASHQLDIALVINNNSDGRLSEVIDWIGTYDNGTRIKIYNYQENIGYLNAMLYVVQEIDIEQYKYVILSNTDIEYQDKTFFNKLLSTDFEPKIGCIAPSVYAIHSNSYSNPHYLERTSKRKLKRLSLVFSNPIIGKTYLYLAHLKNKEKKKTASCYVYSPHGCYMIFTREFIRRISGYIYGAKLYSEEACIGELLLQYGYKCYYYNEIEVVHTCSTVTGKIDYKKRFSLWKNSIDYIIKEFYKNG